MGLRSLERASSSRETHRDDALTRVFHSHPSALAKDYILFEMRQIEQQASSSRQIDRQLREDRRVARKLDSDVRCEISRIVALYMQNHPFLGVAVARFNNCLNHFS